MLVINLCKMLQKIQNFYCRSPVLSKDSSIDVIKPLSEPGAKFPLNEGMTDNRSFKGKIETRRAILVTRNKCSDLICKELNQNLGLVTKNFYFLEANKEIEDYLSLINFPEEMNTAFFLHKHIILNIGENELIKKYFDFLKNLNDESNGINDQILE